MPEIDEPTKKLLNEMGFVPNEKDERDYEIEVEGGYAHVDFRKENGRRWAKVNGVYVKDPESISILNAFKEARDKLQSSSTEQSDSIRGEATSPKLGTPDTLQSPAPKNGDTGNGEAKPVGGFNPPFSLGLDANKEQAVTTKEKPNYQPPTPPVNKNPAPSVFFDEIVPAYEIDICELFGGAGDGKSRVAKKIAEEAIERGKKVLYVDTERGFLKRDLQKLGSSYRYISNLKGVIDLVKNIPKDIDVFILDSVGYPVLTEWAKMGVNERGNSLTQIIAIKDMIKDWAISNGKVALIVNQPDSDFGKEQGYVNRPFGDKGQFIIKEVFLIKRVLSNTTMTKSVIESFRSRHDARGIRIAEVEITSEGVKII